MKRNITEQVIKQLTEMGASRWTKGAHDRLYLNGAAAQLIGLECEYYKSGNISSATMKGEGISNRRASIILASVSSTFIDLTTGGLCQMGTECKEDLIAALDAMCA